MRCVHINIFVYSWLLWLLSLDVQILGQIWSSFKRPWSSSLTISKKIWFSIRLFIFFSLSLSFKQCIFGVKELKLSDFVEIDENLVERIKKSTDISNQGLEENEDNEVLRESLLYQVKNIDTDFFIKTRKEGLYGFV